MEVGLATSLSGALAQARRIDSIANNIANADTPAFKADDYSFEAALRDAGRDDTRADIPERNLTEAELTSRHGEVPQPVLHGNQWTNHRAGSYRQTNNPLDIAIEGNGMLEVLTPSGVRYTRAGNLALDPQGRLITFDGYLVLSAGAAARAAPPPAAGANVLASGGTPNPAATAALVARAIAVGDGQPTIDSEGNIYQSQARGGALVGRLSVVQVGNPAALRKEGSNLFSAGPDAALAPAGGAPGAPRAPANAPAGAANLPPSKPNPMGAVGSAVRVHQGVLEGSNVNPVMEMSKMIEAHRMFEANTKVMNTVSELSRAVGEVGRY